MAEIIDIFAKVISNSYIQELFKWVLVTVIGAWLIPLNLFKYKTIFTKLHEKRADVISELYATIVDMERSFYLLIDPLQFGKKNEEELTIAAIDSINEFKSIYKKSAIYFDADINKVLSEIDNVMHSALAEFQNKTIFKEDEGKKLELWNSAWGKVKQNFPIIKEILSTKFSKILGVNPPIFYKIKTKILGWKWIQNIIKKKSNKKEKT